jgi:hypothetical protein
VSTRLDASAVETVGKETHNCFHRGVELASNFPLRAAESSTGLSGADAIIELVLPANRHIRHVENSVVQR